jgi:hypothetical protein
MSIERFQIHVSDEVLEDLKYRLEHTNWPRLLDGLGWYRCISGRCITATAKMGNE